MICAPASARCRLKTFYALPGNAPCPGTRLAWDRALNARTHDGHARHSSDKLDHSSYDDERGELGGHTLPPAPRVKIVQRINHDGEVNRARYMPQNADLIATKAVSGEVFVFDRTKHSSDPDRSGQCKPDIRLVGQRGEGCVVAETWRGLSH